MKTLSFIGLFFLFILGTNISAQETNSTEKFGNTLNLGLGIGYYGYAERSMPVLHADFEFDVAKSFTLAPFFSFYSYRNDYYPHDNKKYYYHETVILVGAKGTYYFDDLLNANAKWDFYLAGSLGFAISNSRWDDGYPGDKDYYHRANPLFLDLHIGSEYHFNNKFGAFLDLSTGVSTIGLAIHMGK